MSTVIVRHAPLKTDFVNYDNRKIIGHGKTGYWNWSAARGGHSGGAGSYDAARAEASAYAQRYQEDYEIQFVEHDQPMPYEQRETRIIVYQVDKVCWRAEPVCAGSQV